VPGRPSALAPAWRLAVAVWLAAAMLCQPGWAALDLGSLVPSSDSVAGWRLQGKPSAYTRDTLYEYIDGGADFYLGYGFRRVLVAEYAGFGEEKITAELYDMGSSYDAFGVFANDRAAVGPPVGQESSAAGGLLTFWKGSLFVRLFSDRDSERAREAILKLGKAVATALRTTGRKPPLLRLLPAAGLAPTSVRYLHTDTALNNLLYLPGNPLKLGRDTSAAYGEYPKAAGKPIKIVIVRYPDATRARAACLAVRSMYAHTARLRGRYGAVGTVVHGRYVGLVSNAPDSATARRLLVRMLSAFKRSR
jgi:hypothetical protein